MNNASTTAFGWVLRHRSEVNRTLYALGGVLLATTLLGAFAASSASAMAWLGVGLLVAALPWTRWAEIETTERAWRGRDAAAANYRPPIL